MKRKLIILLAMVCCFQFLGMEVSAEGPQISLSSVEGLPGEQVSMNVEIQGNTGLAYLKLKIFYDSSVLTLVKTENTGLLGGTYTTSKTTDVNPYVLQWMGAGNSVGDGTVATLTFEINETAEAGNYSLSLLFEECYDEEFNDVVFSASDGTVTVKSSSCAHASKTEVPSKNADCERSGNNKYYICDTCGIVLKADGITETTVEAETIPAKGHSYSEKMTASTCTEQGYTTHSCSCGESYTDTYMDALGHDLGDWEIVKNPNYLENGLKERHCSRCEVFESEEIPDNPFTDVKADRFEKAILWAFYADITTGTGDGTTFSPENPCTRKQIVTFLWRAAGEPEPKSMENPFTDVKADRFEKAILWAYYEGITTGTGDGTTFSPENTCTRKQIVTFLWRYHGEPKPKSMENKFVDVKNDRFAAAIMWAAEQGITTGTGDGTTFSPENPCIRKQIVTFLYRNLVK